MKKKSKPNFYLISIFIVITILIILGFHYFSNSKDFKGEIIWKKIYFEGQEIVFKDLLIDKNDNILAVGGGEEILLSKLDLNGIFIWNKTINLANHNHAVSLDVDSKENIYILSASTSLDEYSYALFKFDYFGNIIWNLSSNKNLIHIPNSIKIDNLDNIITLTTIKKGYKIGDKFVLNKYDLNGNLIWNITSNGYSTENNYNLDIDKQNNIYISSDSPEFGATLYKYDSNGNLLWNQSFNRLDKIEKIRSIKIIHDSIFLTGSLSENLLILKYDLNGEFLWHKIYNNSEKSFGTDIAFFDKKNIYISGVSDGDYFLLRLDIFGNFYEEFIYDGFGYEDYAYSLDVDSKNQVFMTGHVAKDIGESMLNLKIG